MSASDKKKLRQEAESAAISARAQEEMEKAALRKRNTIIYTIIGIVVVILAAILLIWDSGIVQRNSAVATIDGEKVTAAQVSYYYYNNDLSMTASTYTQYGLTMPYDPATSPREQVITELDVEEWAAYGYTLDESYVGKTYHDYFLDTALDILREEYALRAAAAEAGYTLSDAGKAAVEEGIASVDSQVETYLSYGYNFNRGTYLKQAYGKNMTEKAYRTCLENSILADEYYAEGIAALADYSEAELDAYYQEHTNELDTFRYYFRAFEATTEEEATAEEEAAAQAQAEKDANAALSEVIQGGLNAVVDNEDYTLQLNTPDVGEFHYDWLTDPTRQSGDATVIATDYGLYYLLVFESRYRDETPTVDVRHILVEAANEDDPATDEDESKNDPTDEAYAAAEKKAQELLDQWKAGEATEDSFALLANEHSADPGSNTNGGLYENVANGEMIADFNDWIFDESRQVGDTGIVKNTSSYTKGWHIIYFAGQDEPTWVTTARDAKWAAELKDNVEIVRTDKLDSIFN